MLHVERLHRQSVRSSFGAIGISQLQCGAGKYFRSPGGGQYLSTALGASSFCQRLPHAVQLVRTVEAVPYTSLDLSVFMSCGQASGAMVAFTRRDEGSRRPSPSAIALWRPLYLASGCR